MEKGRSEQLWKYLHLYQLLETGQPNVSSSNEALDICLDLAQLFTEAAQEFRPDALTELEDK